MKKMVIILLMLMTTKVNSQTYKTYDLSECPLKSKIWKSEYRIINNIKGTHFTPINGDNFSVKYEYVESNINETEIEKSLLESFNEFRKDYNIDTVSEDKNLSKECKKYSTKISSNLVHDKNIDKKTSECCVNIPMMSFTKITKNDGNLNKLISESCFDIFVGCPAHMSILLNSANTIYGFGITVNHNHISVVIRCY